MSHSLTQNTSMAPTHVGIQFDPYLVLGYLSGSIFTSLSLISWSCLRVICIGCSLCPECWSLHGLFPHFILISAHMAPPQRSNFWSPSLRSSYLLSSYPALCFFTCHSLLSHHRLTCYLSLSHSPECKLHDRRGSVICTVSHCVSRA